MAHKTCSFWFGVQLPFNEKHVNVFSPGASTEGGREQDPLVRSLPKMTLCTGLWRAAILSPGHPHCVPLLPHHFEKSGYAPDFHKCTCKSNKYPFPLNMQYFRRIELSPKF